MFKSILIILYIVYYFAKTGPSCLKFYGYGYTCISLEVYLELE